ncbi:MAG: CBS domain-containing protein [Chloroflexi bacterium]|nr:CBS domain-containing protein [Chloroflexota bacterium]
MLVGKRMSHPVITVYPETTLEEALTLMHEEKIRRLPVINQRGELVGIISERVILRALPSDATTLSVWESRDMVRKMTVSQYMVSDVITIAEDTPLEEAARIMTDNQISALPVMRGGKLVGMITEKDLFKIFLELLGARDPGVRFTALVTKGPGRLLNITKAIFDLGGDILAMGAFEGETSEDGEITIKVAGVKMQDLVEALTPLVEEVVDVRVSTPA